MPSYELVVGDLLDAPEKYLVHQCNCLGRNAGGLARVMFDRFPWSDVYAEREGQKLPLAHQQPGSIQICGNGADQRFVIALYGQLHGGGLDPEHEAEDGEDARRRMFATALSELLDERDLESIAFPYQIGCGIAGGDWAWYSSMIEAFALNAAGRGVVTKVYRHPDLG